MGAGIVTGLFGSGNEVLDLENLLELINFVVDGMM